MFVRRLVVLAVLLVVCGGTEARTRALAPSAGDTFAPSFPRPNFIVILTDDQRADTLSFMPLLQQRLVQRGITFRNSFVTTALCCPSRASLLTGRYAHNHGVLFNKPPHGGVEAFDDSSTLATWLSDAGYETALVGKYLNRYAPDNQDFDFSYVPPGWSRWFGYGGFYYDYFLNDDGTVRHFGTSPADYSTDVLREHAVEFVEQAQAPFFLLFAPYAPHGSDKPSTGDPTPVPPPAAGTCADPELPNPPSMNPNLTADDFVWMRRWRSRYLCSLQGVDRAVAEILDAIPPDEFDETVVIFTSDNGFAFGEHRRTTGKSCQYEECLRVPLVISYPALTNEPREETRIALNIDLAPTILELAGIASVPGPIDGLSLAPLLTGQRVQWRKDFLFEHYTPSLNAMTAGVRGVRYKLVDRLQLPDELYDLRYDPYEINNVFRHPAYRGVRQDLRKRLAELRNWPAPPPPP